MLHASAFKATEIHSAVPMRILVDVVDADTPPKLDEVLGHIDCSFSAPSISPYHRLPPSQVSQPPVSLEP